MPPLGGRAPTEVGNPPRDASALSDGARLVHAGWPEGLWLLEEGEQCYVLGQFVASLLCAHACCERTLAAYLELFGSLGRRLANAGLGPVAAAARERGLITSDLFDRLISVNEIRKVMAHFKSPTAPYAAVMRLGAMDAGHVVDADAAFQSLLAEDAETALRAAMEISMGIGFNSR
jgi:hypothetical protein